MARLETLDRQSAHSQDRTIIVPPWSILAAMYMLALGAIFYYLTESMVIIYAAAVLIVVTVAQYTITSLFYGQINILALAASQTVLWYALPFSYAWLFEYESYLTNSLAATSNGLLAVTAIAICAYWAAYTWRPVTLPLISKTQAKDQGVVFLLPFVVLQIGMLATNSWGKDVMLDQAAYAEAQASALSMIAAAITPAVAPTAAYLLGAAQISKHPRSLNVWFYACTLGLQLVWWLPIGRRTMAIALATAMLAFFSARFERVLTPSRKLTLGLGGLLSLGLIYALWKAFYTFRVASYSMPIEGISAKMNIFDLAQAQSAVAAADVDDNFAENLLSRPFIINSFATVRETATDFLYGLQFLTQLILSAPKALLPIKNELIENLGGVNEDLWTALVNVPWTDHANTVALEGYLDLGVLGGVALMVLLCAVLRLILTCTQLVGSETLSIYIFFAVFSHMLSVENATAAYLNCARSLLIVIGITYALRTFSAASR